MDEIKKKIMRRLRKRLRPQNLSKKRPTINVRNNRVTNRLVKGNKVTQSLRRADNLLSGRSSIKQPKFKRGAVTRMNSSSPGSLKRSRKRSK